MVFGVFLGNICELGVVCEFAEDCSCIIFNFYLSRRTISTRVSRSITLKKNTRKKTGSELIMLVSFQIHKLFIPDWQLALIRHYHCWRLN